MRAIAIFGLIGSTLVFLHGAAIGLGSSLGGGPDAPYWVKLGERLALLAIAAGASALVALVATFRAGAKLRLRSRWAPHGALLSIGLLIVAELMAYWAFIGRYWPEERALDSYRPPPGGTIQEEHRIGGEQPEILRIYAYSDPDLSRKEVLTSLKRWSCTGRVGYQGDHDTARCGNRTMNLDERFRDEGGTYPYVRVTRIR